MVINFFSDFCFPGGISVHQGELAKVLDKKYGCNVNICIPWPLRYDMKEHIDLIEKYKEIGMLESFYDGLKYLCYVDSLECMKRMVSMADINHFHGSFSTNRDFLGEVIQASPKYKNLYTFHSEAINPKCNSDIGELLKRIDNVEKICAVSENVKLNVHSITNREIYITNNGYSSVSSVRNGNSFTILFIGRLNYTKGVENIIRFGYDIEKYDMKMIVVGDSEFDNIYHNEMERLVRCNSNVVWIEQSVSHKEILNLYKESDVFYFPSHMEGQPLVVLDALANGCVPVVSYAGGMGQIINNGVNGYVFGWDEYEKQKETIINLYKDKELLKKIKRKTFEIKLNTWEKTADYLYDLYSTMIDEKNRKN